MSRILPKVSVSSSVSAKATGSSSLASRLSTFWKFARPHTVIGTSLSVLALYLIALAESGWDATRGLFPPPLALTLPIALLACLGGNIYIVGLNQLEDVAIDRINKPHLPLASGEYSRQQGNWIVAIAGLVAILLAVIGGPFCWQPLASA